MKQSKVLVLCSGILLMASASYASINLSIDSTTTQSSTSWSGSPAGTLAQSIDTPNLQNSQDGGVSSGIIFKAGSSFTLGAVEIDEAFLTGAGNFNVVMYDLGSSYALPGTSPVYTFTGSESDLLSAGDNVHLTSGSSAQFDVLTLSGESVSINSGDSYWFGLVATDGSVLTWERGPITANQDIAVNSSVAVGGAGSVLNNGGTGANRTPIAAFFAVPEPVSMAFCGLGLAAVVLLRRRSA